MRYITFRTGENTESRLGLLRDSNVIDVTLAWDWASRARGWTAPPPPRTLLELIQYGPEGQNYARQAVEVLLENESAGISFMVYRADSVILRSPIEHPATIRDFYAFEEHVQNAYKIRLQPVPDEWYQLPVFYYSNPGSIYGCDELIPIPGYTKALDYELEIAFVIGKTGRDISRKTAREFIFGLMIMNDWSARDIQRVETRVRLGPAKSKDFATSLGPCLVTLDELSSRETSPDGVFDLCLSARVNGETLSRGNLKDIHYSFAEMIERASMSCTLYPGEVFGSGTIGGGCLLELTGGEGPWLMPGDTIELEADCLGVLRNTISGIDEKISSQSLQWKE